jgi:hypothetical protein
VFPRRLLPPKSKAGIPFAVINQRVCRDGYFCHQPFEKDKSMKLESLREIKHHFLGNPAATFAVGIARPEQKMRRSIALGIGANGKLAVRCYGGRNQSRLQNAFVEAIMKQCRNEADVVRGLEMPMAFGWMDELKRQLGMTKQDANTGRTRPLLAGFSTGHTAITAGSLGFFAKLNGDKRMGAVSNNHIFANCNDAKIGDRILQNAPYDGGKVETDTIGTLHSFVKLVREHNKVDCAFVLINDGIECNVADRGEFGQYQGDGDGNLEVGMQVKKRGRTTGYTRGVISAIEVDSLQVDFGRKLGVLSFDDQVEIKADEEDFSAGGDSGSGILDDQNRGVALLFAGGGHAGRHRTYGNDLTNVLKALKIKTVK